MKSINFIFAICLLSLVAFRPWRSINQALGVRNVADSVNLAGPYADTMLVSQPIQVVLPPSMVDSLVAKVIDQKADKAILEAQNHKLDRDVAGLKKSNAEKQSTLVSEQEIENLLVKQNQKRPAGESELERELNKPPSHNGPK